ncbi:MAG: CDP-alcohol phosphatidyltransferase family protein [Acidobacteriota bacterium]
MISVYDAKPRFQAFLRPCLGPLVHAGLRPNHVTLAALVGSIAIGGLVAAGHGDPRMLLLLPPWLLLRMALNAIDGMMARAWDLATPLGAVLNEVGDVLSDIALYLPLAAAGPGASVAVVCFVIAAVLTEFVGVAAAAAGARRRYDGPMGKSDRALWVGALALISGLAPATIRVWPWFFSAAAALCLLTVLLRGRRALADLALERGTRTGSG